jgi:hypothetical protein
MRFDRRNVMYTFSPKYQNVARLYGVDESPRTEATPVPEPERLFGDPPPKRNRNWLEDIAFLVSIISLAWFALYFWVEKNSRKPDGRSHPVPTEVEK